MRSNRTDNPDYLAKKSQFENMITLYGRKPVLEVLQSNTIEIYRLHLARLKKTAPIVEEIITLAKRRGIDIAYHERGQLSRISKNARQDQGVAVDLIAPGYRPLSSLQADELQAGFELLLLDGVTNPQNLGMIIRSVAASPMAGIILLHAGSAKIDPLVFKASAGTLLKTKIFHSHNIDHAIENLQLLNLPLYGLDATGSATLAEIADSNPKVLAVGNESTGLSPTVQQSCRQTIRIPLANQVESLNVSAAATLIAFRSLFQTVE